MAKRLIPIADVPANSVLGAPLTDASGQVLLPAGAQLPPSLLESLKRRGIAAVPLAVPDDWSPLDEAEKAQLIHHVDYLFRQAGQGPAVDKLRSLVLEYRLQNTGTGSERQKP